MLNRFRKRSLTRQILYLILIMLMILLIAFTIQDRIAKQIIERKVTESVETISQQVIEKMNSFDADIKGISTFLFYSPTVQSYLNTEDEMTRILDHREVLSMFDNTNSMKTNIRGIQLYDTAGKQLARFGEGDNLADITLVKELTYSGLLELDTRPTEHFYAITTPVYGIDSNGIVTELKGIGRFYMDVTNLSPILASAAITPNAQVRLLDAENRTIAGAGSVEGGESFQVDDWSRDSDYIVQTFTLPRSNWKLVSVIPKDELLADLDTIKRFNITTYLVMFVLFQLFLVLFSNRILKPIRALLDFVKTYPKQGGSSRFQVALDNEVGVLGTNLNKMLDEISVLSDEVQAAQKRMYEVELTKKQMEVSAFRNQINPHFLYNTLESIRAVAFYHGVQDIADISESLSKMFRYAVKAGNVVTLQDEIAHVQEYARITDFRFRGRFRFQFDVEEQLLNVSALKMLLQPLVENAVFHGLERKVGPGMVWIDVYRMADQRIQVSIRDNGIGMDGVRLQELTGQLVRYDERDGMHEESGQGIGMLNIYRRIKLFYGDAADMTLTSRLNEGTTVTVTFPDQMNESFGGG
ncbi:two-component system sensor histidine kinase YesM [Paenibacillus phyllosphaerae]|uniref:histidine kinase n=1 Tax=Paenibacillus phyllosphaerae TaxID=274593 RepID=A0A7W5B296_9BACL|nr:sensor histidine kinase [Paenibacillus phyllosphaerae]MBB3113120.1 two-component system sensor histidine kinase YesM [Paenibacillus phyllosphaerae]